MRLDDSPGSFARLATAIGEAAGSLGAIDLVRVERHHKVRDVTVLAADQDHLDRIVAAVHAVEGIEVEHVSDRTFLMHLGGKIEVVSRVPLKTRDDLSMAYTPGVARVSSAIAKDPASVWNLTIKANTVAVVTDGTAVLGLGDIGPAGALPVMEGKALLFKEFGGVDAFPICLATKDADEIVRTVEAIAPVFGGINLEDISAPRCFEIERRLRDSLDIPVFHDDQHGTAIVVLAALLNALRVVGKPIDQVRVVMTGVGAAGVAVAQMLVNAGVHDLIGCDRHGAICRGEDLAAEKAAFAQWTNPRGFRGTADEALAGADVFLGLSGPGAISAEGVRTMAEGAIVFAMANPTPEVQPEEIEDA
ncbi:MAG TPA: malic enzyme-like NAD(P)-binding protein, partial [Gaiellaceae bacterium]|nr:malic enzyme-like NAD(P)-binding protein [Gaiellaceae bacterium]